MEGFSEKLSEMRVFIEGVFVQERPKSVTGDELLRVVRSEWWDKKMKLLSSMALVSIGSLSEKAAQVEIYAIREAIKWWAEFDWRGECRRENAAVVRSRKKSNFSGKYYLDMMMKKEFLEKLGWGSDEALRIVKSGVVRSLPGGDHE